MQVGFSQRIRLEWLEQAARLAASGASRDQAAAALDELLHDQLSVSVAVAPDGSLGPSRSGGAASASRTNRSAAITILLRTWVVPPARLRALHNEGLALLAGRPAPPRLALHWGTVLAIYPFVGLVAETTGRLLRLQGVCAAAEVQRRVCEQLGERETVARAVRRVLRCFVDWGTLRDAQRPGAYAPREFLAIDDRRLAVWLVEAALLARGADAAGLRSLAQAPALFPFRVRPPSAADLASHPRLELLVQGLSEQMVARR